VNLPPFTDASTLVELAITAERAGWDAVFVWDHVQWIPELGLDTHDPWALLSAMAVRTERVKLGTAVTPLARRRPQVLAKQIVTLDHLSGGRAMVGVGLGAPPDGDFGAFGEEVDDRIRAERLDESLGLLDRLLRGEQVDHDGPQFTVHATLLPASVQSPRPPIFVAGTWPNRRPLERSLRWDGFFPIGDEGFVTPAELAGYVGDADRPAGWELFASSHPDHAAGEFEAVGVDWLVDSFWPMGDWVTELTGSIEAGPRT
jgi:hypothetical protein